jgi:hypothetical protein
VSYPQARSRNVILITDLSPCRAVGRDVTSAWRLHACNVLTFDGRTLSDAGRLVGIGGQWSVDVSDSLNARFISLSYDYLDYLHT